MKSFELLYEKAMDNWRDNKGIGTAVIPDTLDYKPFVLGILQRVYSRSPTARVLVTTPEFNERAEFIEYITHQDIEENNDEFKKLIELKYLHIFTADFLSKLSHNPNYLLVIVIHPYSIDPAVFSRLNFAKFKLVVMNKLFSKQEDNAILHRICPTLTDFQANEIIAARASTPVEEELIGVSIDDTEMADKLAKYNEYITQSISIFGSFETMEKVHRGDSNLNISAKQMCYTIAEENGWNDHLDMSYPFNVQLDEMYNPNNLQERVKTTYELIRLRSNLVTDYEGKLPAILDVVNKHKDKKILIISKRGEFASVVCDYLNNSNEHKICLPYHDKLAPIPLSDSTGQPILIKTGSHKGEQKIIAQKAQKSLNQKQFNMSIVNVLSTNAAPDKDLTIDVEVVIITSPKCNEIEDYIYRLNNVCFPDGKILLYTIYCEDTFEENVVFNKHETNTHRIVNKFENMSISAENSGVRIDM